MRSFFIRLSESRRLRNIAENSRIGNRLSRRFVAGMSVQEALEASRAVNELGLTVSVDNLGENVTHLEEARHSAKLYHDMLDAIDANALEANVSLKLTHMGLDVDPELARNITDELVSHAARIDNFVRVDMEGSEYTQRTLDLVRELHRKPENKGHVGAVIQAYLFRSEQDVRDLCAEGIRIRLCKGAYKEPPTISFAEKKDTDANFVKLMKIMLQSGTYHGIATHDEAMINATKQFAMDEGISPESFEFQMLYGVRRDLQQKLRAEGWGVRVYIPFGTEWYPYLMRRLAERPANALFILRNLLR